MNNTTQSASLPQLSFPSPGHYTQHQSLPLIQPFYQLFFCNHFSQFFTILKVRHYFDYLHFHTLTITPAETTIPDPKIRILVVSPLRSLNHSPDLCCVGAQTIIFLERFLAQPTYLLLGGSRPASTTLFLDLAENGCPDPENQDICKQYINPCFTILCHQILSLPMGSKFHAVHPVSNNSVSFCTLPTR